MTPPAGRSPLIAGADVSGGNAHEFDDDLTTSSFFDFYDSPDALQGLDMVASSDHKGFLNPQDLTADPLADASHESFHDSSSESASKRTGSSVSAKTPATSGDLAMDECADVKMEWANSEYAAFDEDDATFTFGGDDPDSSAILDGIYPFGDNDDSFMHRSFDLKGASSSPEARPARQMSMPSPEMPVIKTSSPRKPHAAKKSKPSSHKKQASQQSAASSQRGPLSTGSRDVSPMSAMVASHDSSPAATFLNSPSPSAGLDHHRFPSTGHHAKWPNHVAVTAHGRPTALPTPMQFPLSVPMPHHLSLYHPGPFHFSGGYELRIMPTPLKSRVETQIPIKMTLSPLPPGVAKLHLPAHTISKPKLLAKPPPERCPDMLELHATLVCTSAMEQPGMRQKALDRAAKLPQRHLPDLDEENAPQNGGDVRICQGCITRERKRAARKKIKKPEEEKLWSLDEERRVIVFNTQEIKEWQPLSDVLDATGRPELVLASHAMQIDALMRIACYCRHHNEKMGFNVIFTIKDFQDRVIAQAMSDPIMITDDHKTHPMAQPSSQPMSEAVTTSTVPAPPSLTDPQPPLALTPGSSAFKMSSPLSHVDPSMMHPDASQMPHATSKSSSNSGKTTPTMPAAQAPSRSLSRSASPPHAAPTAKKRKSSGAGPRVSNGLTMTRLETSPPPTSSQVASAPLSTVASPFSPASATLPQLEHTFLSHGSQPPFASGPPTPGATDPPPPPPPPLAAAVAARSASMENLTMAQLYSAPASSHPSRAPSPTGLRSGVNVSQSQFAQTLASSLYALPLGIAPARTSPVIHKIIPNEGPTVGGIEVTVLGQAFFQGLEVWFGDQKATTTTYWGDSSLVCLLPPSPVASPIAVKVKHQGMSGTPSFPVAKEPPVFKYIDDSEDKIIRTALAVLAHKMSGQMMDVSDLVRRILHDGNPTWSIGSPLGSSGGSGYGHASSSPHEHLESQLLKCLDLIDLDDSLFKTRLELRMSTGHTMLHMACSLGYHRFVAALLARRASADARDKGGFTPLHLAALRNHAEIVRRLMLVGADATIRSLSGLTAADVAQSRSVLRAIRRSERHARSVSSTSLRSRADSAQSLRSLWEPMTKVRTHDGPTTAADLGEESPEYTSGDLEDEDPDEDSQLTMGRQRRNTQTHDEDLSVCDADEGATDEQARGLRFQPPQIAALKEHVQQQLHHFQQSMALHLQNLPQMPHLPTLPGMPVLSDYQVYLQQAPFMRRVQQLMPGSGGAQPNNLGRGADQGKVDSRWWDIISYM